MIVLDRQGNKWSLQYTKKYSRRAFTDGRLAIKVIALNGAKGMMQFWAPVFDDWWAPQPKRECELCRDKVHTYVRKTHEH